MLSNEAEGSRINLAGSQKIKTSERDKSLFGMDFISSRSRAAIFAEVRSLGRFGLQKGFLQYGLLQPDNIC